MNFNDTIRCQVTLWPVDEQEPRRPYCAVLSYRAADPYAVHLTLPRHDQPGARTMPFGRALFIDGLEKPSGDGVVRVEPHIVDRDYTALTLPVTRDGSQFYAERAPLERFLDATLRIVPLGGESARIDWDGLAERLTSADRRTWLSAVRLLGRSLLKQLLISAGS